MVTVLTSVDWLSVGLAFVAYFMLGPLWYLFLFPRQYRISLGRKPDEPQSSDPLFIAGPAVCSLIITLTSAVLFCALNITTYGNAALFATLVGLGYLVANTVNIAINPNIPRPFLYGAISGSYHLVGMVVVTMILVAMK